MKKYENYKDLPYWSCNKAEKWLRKHPKSGVWKDHGECFIVSNASNGHTWVSRISLIAYQRLLKRHVINPYNELASHKPRWVHSRMAVLKKTKPEGPNDPAAKLMWLASRIW